MTSASQEPSETRVKYPRLERGGFMWGLDGVQFMVTLAGLISLVFMLVFAGPKPALVWSVIAIPVVAFGIASWGERTLISRTRVLGEHIVRRAAGKTIWKISEKPIDVGALPLPGKPGARVSVFGTKWAQGAVIFDAGAQTASVALRCESVGWPLSDEREQRAGAFANVCRGLLRRPFVERVAIQARTIPATKVAAVNWHEATAKQRGVEDPWGQEVMAAVLDGDQFVGAEGQPVGPESKVVPVQRDTMVILTVNMRKAARPIKAAGGGVAGAAQVLATEVRRFSQEVKSCGVTQVEWLTPAQVGDAIRVAMDPEAADRVQQMAGERVDENSLSHAAPMFVDDDNPNMLLTSGGAHQTYWVGQWPQTEVGVGFLESLICEGDYPHVVTIVFSVEGTESALRAIQDRRFAMQSKKMVNEKLGRPASILDEVAEDDLRLRELELAKGEVNVRASGFVRVSGATEEDLELNVQAVLRDAVYLDLQLLKRQQWEAFCASSLPLGWGM